VSVGGGVCAWVGAPAELESLQVYAVWSWSCCGLLACRLEARAVAVAPIRQHCCIAHPCLHLPLVRATLDAFGVLVDAPLRTTLPL
jgi:hypothetical protein